MKEKRVIIGIDLDVRANDGFYSNFVGSLYTHYLPAVNADKISKILILFKRETGYEVYSDDAVIGVYTMLKSFDYQKFEKSKHEEKCEILCDEIYSCLTQIFVKQKIDLTPLNSTYARIKENNYKLRFLICGGPKENKAKTIVGTVVSEHFLGYALLTVNFLLKKDSSNKEVILCKCAPGYFIYSRLFSSVKWDDNSNFRILNKAKDISFIINIDGNISVDYDSVIKEESDVKEEIKYLTQEIYFQV